MQASLRPGGGREVAHPGAVRNLAFTAYALGFACAVWTVRSAQEPEGRMMPDETLPLIDWNGFARTRAQLGGSFIRILGYFVEDGLKSVSAIEDAIRSGNAAAMILPAHTLKSEARQFGGERLGQLAEDIELYARQCVETHESPEDYVDRVVKLRPLFAAMLAEIEAESNPLVQRKQGFGRRVA